MNDDSQSERPYGDVVRLLRFVLESIQNSTIEYHLGELNELIREVDNLTESHCQIINHIIHYDDYYEVYRKILEEKINDDGSIEEAYDSMDELFVDMRRYLERG